MLTKKYYERIAEILRISESKEEIIRRLADFFGEDNALFDNERFLKATEKKR